MSDVGSCLRTSSRTWVTSSVSVAPGSTSESGHGGRDLLAQGLAEGSDPVLRRRCRCRPVLTWRPATDDVHQVRHPARFAFGRAEQMG